MRECGTREARKMVTSVDAVSFLFSFWPLSFCNRREHTRRTENRSPIHTRLRHTVAALGGASIGRTDGGYVRLQFVGGDETSEAASIHPLAEFSHLIVLFISETETE